MTDKRFEKISVCGDDGVKDTVMDIVLFFGTSDEVDCTLELLNELTDENEELKYENQNLRFEMGVYEQKIADLEKENEKLLIDSNNLVDDNTELDIEYTRLYKENEKLKSENNRLIKKTAETIAENTKKILEVIDERIEEARECRSDRRCDEKHFKGEMTALVELKENIQNDFKYD